MIERESGEKEEKSSDTWDQKSGIPEQFESFFAKKSIGSHELGEKKLSDIKSILDKVKEWEVQSLSLRKTVRLKRQSSRLIFSDRSKYQVPCILELRKNNIRSVEGMSRCAMPILQKLLMGSNQVVWIKEMRKIYCPSLDNIDIGTERNNTDENYVNDGERLTELRMPKNMHEFDIEWQGTRLFKTEAESINHFRAVLRRHSDEEQVEDGGQVRQKVEGRVDGRKCLFQLIGVDCSSAILSDKLKSAVKDEK